MNIPRWFTELILELICNSYYIKNIIGLKGFNKKNTLE